VGGRAAVGVKLQQMRTRKRAPEGERLVIEIFALGAYERHVAL